MQQYEISYAKNAFMGTRIYNNSYPILNKIVLILITLCALGLPLNEPWKFIAFALSLGLILVGTIRSPISNKLFVAFLMISIGIRFIPTLTIDEGHYILVTSDNQLIDPQDVIQKQKIPPGFSSESFWRPSKLSRAVSNIQFDSLAKAKVGTINDNAYNFYNGSSPWNRNLLPFMIVYILPHKAIGLSLSWQGQAFWPGNNTFEKIDHSTYASKVITDADVEKPIYFTSTLTNNNQALTPLKIALEPTSIMQIKEYAKIGISVALVLLLLFYSLSWGNLHAMCLVASILTLQFAYIWFYAPYLISESRPLMGGCDGLVHYGFARQMLAGLKSLDFLTFLKGTEDVFFFMPGMRYIRAFEMLIFGDNFYGYALFFCLIPYGIYIFLRHFFEKITSLAFVALSVLPLNRFLGFTGLSNDFYLDIVTEGYGEAFSYMAFIMGVYHILRSFEPYKASTWGHFCLFIAISVRPNLLISGAYLMIISALWHLQNSIHYQRTIALSWLGFLPIILIPLHNLVFGHTFVPLTKAVDYVQNIIVTPESYLNLLASLLNFKYTFFLNTQNYYSSPQILPGQDVQSLTKILLQFYEYFIVGGLIKIPLMWFVFKNAFKGKIFSKIHILSVMTILIGLPFLFYGVSIRYTFIVWFLAFTVALHDIFSRLDQKYNLNLTASHVS